jgi:hypothetical protein
MCVEDASYMFGGGRPVLATSCSLSELGGYTCVAIKTVNILSEFCW